MITGGEFLTSRVGSEQIFTPETFSEDQREFKQLAREFALQEIKPNKDKLELYDRELMRGLLRKAGEIGFLGIDVPEEYGGLSLDKVTSVILTEMLGYGESASFNVSIAAHVSIGTLPIVFFGTEEQKQKYLPKLVSAEWLSAYCLTEPTAGSDALSIRSTAVLSEDKKHYIINGVKQFITNGGWADMYIVFARVDGEKFSAFIVERDTPGISIGVEEKKLGQKGASTCAVTFENVPVPVENVLHEIGKGVEVAFNSLNIGRFKLGAADLGGLKAATNLSVQYALERWQFGHPIAHFEAIKKKFGDMLLRTYAVESMLYRTAGLLDDSISKADPASENYFSEVAKAIERYAIECSMCKIFSSEALWIVADSALQVYGGYGFIEEYPLARLNRDARVDRLYEGTNEVNRQVIVGYFLKKALLEELPLREAVKNIPDLVAGKLPEFSGPLAAEMTGLEIAKSLAVLLFHHTLTKFGQDIMNEQQWGELLSDLFMEIYAVDSTLSRVQQHLDSQGHDEIRLKLGRAFAAERIPNIIHETERGLRSLLSGKSRQEVEEQLRAIRSHMPHFANLFQLRSDLADELYLQGEYWL